MQYDLFYLMSSLIYFLSIPAEVMKASQQAIERGVKDCLFIDYKRRSGHFDVTTVASIKEMTEKVTVGIGLYRVHPAISPKCFTPSFAQLSQFYVCV